MCLFTLNESGLFPSGHLLKTSNWTYKNVLVVGTRLRRYAASI